jgi:DNA-binding protein YbaB
MFEKLKKLKELQSFLAQERTRAEKKGVRIVLNGKMQVEEIAINPELSKDEQEKALKECFNEAIRELQMKLAKQMPMMGL